MTKQYRSADIWRLCIAVILSFSITSLSLRRSQSICLFTFFVSLVYSQPNLSPNHFASLSDTFFLNQKCWSHISKNKKYKEIHTHRCKRQTIVFTNRKQQNNARAFAGSFTILGIRVAKTTTKHSNEMVMIWQPNFDTDEALFFWMKNELQMSVRTHIRDIKCSRSLSLSFSVFLFLLLGIFLFVTATVSLSFSISLSQSRDSPAHTRTLRQFLRRHKLA